MNRDQIVLSVAGGIAGIGFLGALAVSFWDWSRSKPEAVFEMSLARTNLPAKSLLIGQAGRVEIYSVTYKGAEFVVTSQAEIIPLKK